MNATSIDTAVSAALGTWLLVVLACGLDRLLGDPRRWLHPVQVMGWVITGLRSPAEAWARDRPAALRLAGVLITLLLVGGSAASGLAVERLALALPLLGLPLLLIGLASALAGRSLEQAVASVLAGLADGDLERARAQLGRIVGRDVDGLTESGILRAAAETAAENAVDGLFAPLFWMLVGAGIWTALGVADGAPGPLSLAWAFKAASTLDSMLGYRRGRLRWLGTAGARLDDLLTWLPARLVAFTLPAAAGRLMQGLQLGREALCQGRTDPSPNAGVSMAAFALAGQVRLGGVNHYSGAARVKPILGRDHPAADPASVALILRLNARLEGLWLALSLPLLLGLSQVRGLVG